MIQLKSGRRQSNAAMRLLSYAHFRPARAAFNETARGGGWIIARDGYLTRSLWKAYRPGLTNLCAISTYGTTKPMKPLAPMKHWNLRTFGPHKTINLSPTQTPLSCSSPLKHQCCNRMRLANDLYRLSADP